MERLTKERYPFLDESVLTALNDHDIFTARDFISYDSQKLAKISLLLFKEILDIKKTLRRKHAAVSENGFECYQDLLKNSAFISSGIKSVDQFLEGGLLTGNIYEIYGAAACGKSLLAYSFMKNLVMKMKQNCFILDSKHDFSAKKFHSLCWKSHDDEVMNSLSKIFIKYIENKYDLLNSLKEISDELEKSSFILRFIIIDSLAVVIGDDNNHFVNNLCLSHLANIMHFIATKYDVVILVINLMTTWVEGDFVTQTETKQTAMCGRFWYSVPNTRIRLERQYKNLKLGIEKSNTLPIKTMHIPFTDIITHDLNI